MDAQTDSKRISSTRLSYAQHGNARGSSATLTLMACALFGCLEDVLANTCDAFVNRCHKTCVSNMLGPKLVEHALDLIESEGLITLGCSQIWKAIADGHRY